MEFSSPSTNSHRRRKGLLGSRPTQRPLVEMSRQNRNRPGRSVFPESILHARFPASRTPRPSQGSFGDSSDRRNTMWPSDLSRDYGGDVESLPSHGTPVDPEERNHTHQKSCYCRSLTPRVQAEGLLGDRRAQSSDDQVSRSTLPMPADCQFISRIRAGGGPLAAPPRQPIRSSVESRGDHLCSHRRGYPSFSALR